MKHWALLLSIFLVFATANPSGAATASPSAQADFATGSADDFFGPTHLYTFHLSIAADQWAIMQRTDQLKENAGRGPLNNGGPGRLRPPGGPPGGGNGPGGMGPMMGIEFNEGTATLEFEGRSFGAIRVRFKGNSSFNSSRNSLKHSLKLDFNDLQKGRKFFGLTKLNLNNNAMDPSQLREALAYDIFRHGGVPAGRTAFARVYLTVPGRFNKTYAGLYTAVEQVDERFLKDRFGTRDGLLLKPEHAPGLPYFGDDWSSYTNLLQPKNTATAADTSHFIEFVKSLNRDGDAQFRSAVPRHADVDEFLRFMAVQALLSNMDSPLMTGHNYYLWLNPTTRQLAWLPWDLNEAFGGFLRAGTIDDQIALSIEHPYTRVNRLAERLMDTPATKMRYHEIVRGLLATNFNSARLFPLIDAMVATIRPALSNEPTVTLAQFEAAISTRMSPADGFLGEGGGFRGRPGGPGGPRRPRAPLKFFITQRSDSVQKQLVGKSRGYVPPEMRPGFDGGPPPPGRPR